MKIKQEFADTRCNDNQVKNHKQNCVKYIKKSLLQIIKEL